MNAKACELCQKLALHKCGGCRRIYYCSKQHQRQHWDVHRNSCKAFKRGHDRGIVATRDIAYGEVILQEAPLLWGPGSGVQPVCLGCTKTLADKSNWRSCRKCGWLVCSDLCEKAPAHLPECQYTVHHGKKMAIKNFDNPRVIYDVVLVLRCLYRKQFIPKVWSKLERLEREGIEKSNKHRAIVSSIWRIFLLASVFTDEDIVKAYNIVMSSSFEVPMESSQLAIYPTASAFEHECTSNCSKTFTSDSEIVVTACRPIRAGDRLSLCYTDPLWGTSNRRYFLHETKLFWCQCVRCQDPTEFGTFFSALKCSTASCPGFLLPDTFTDIRKLSKWICTKCEKSISSYSAYDIVEPIGHEFYDLDKSELMACKVFLKTCSNYLCGNHFYNAQIMLVLAQLLGTDCTDEDLEWKLEICQKLEGLIRILAPSESEMLQRVVGERSAAFAERTRRTKTEDLESSTVVPNK